MSASTTFRNNTASSNSGNFVSYSYAQSCQWANTAAGFTTKITMTTGGMSYNVLGFKGITMQIVGSSQCGFAFISGSTLSTYRVLCTVNGAANTTSDDDASFGLAINSTLMAATAVTQAVTGHGAYSLTMESVFSGNGSTITVQLGGSSSGGAGSWSGAGAFPAYVPSVQFNLLQLA